MTESEKRGKTALRLVFTHLGLKRAFDRSTDEAVLLNRATIAVASSMSTLNLAANIDAQARTDDGPVPLPASLESLWTMFPSSVDFQRAQDLVATFHLTALESLRSLAPVGSPPMASSWSALPVLASSPRVNSG